MTDKEKLIELLDGIQSHGWRRIETDHSITLAVVENKAIAEHLLANGVTVQRWIPVTERLPEEGEYVLCVLKGFNYGGKIQVCKFVPADKFKDKPYFEHFRNGFPSVTHWMPLPEPPEEG